MNKFQLSVSILASLTLALTLGTNNAFADGNANSSIIPSQSLSLTTNNTNNNVIVISKSYSAVSSVAISNFNYVGNKPNGQAIENIIGDDLTHSGLFNPVYASSFPQSIDSGALNPSLWVSRKLNYLVIGQVVNTGNNLTLNYKLFSMNGQLCAVGTPCVQKTVSAPVNQPRLLAHLAAQDIFKVIKNRPINFTGKLAYVNQPSVNQSFYTVNISDYDGYNNRTILSSKHPIMGLEWSPDNSNIVFTTFGTFSSFIKSYNLTTAKVKTLVGTVGNNNAPSYSSDGRYLAYSRGVNGVYDIYVLNLATGVSTNLTHGIGYNTEPVWFGNTLIFTSTRQNGIPAIFTMNLDGSGVRRISQANGQTTDPQIIFNSDNRYMAYINNNHLTTQYLATGQVNYITNTFLDESETISKYGNMLIYSSSTQGTNKILNLVSANGQYIGALSNQSGANTSPAWSK